MLYNSICINTLTVLLFLCTIHKQHHRDSEARLSSPPPSTGSRAHGGGPATVLMIESGDGERLEQPCRNCDVTVGKSSREASHRACGLSYKENMID